MPIQRLNHAVLYVRDAERSAAFYAEVLGFRRLTMAEGMRGAIFLQAPGSTNDHDLGLFTVGEQPGPGGIGLYHLAWEVDTLDELERIGQALTDAGALTGASDHGTTKAIYAKDPDGIEFEVSWLVPKELIDGAAVEARSRIGRLDLRGEKARYGADTEGGVGVSHAVNGPR
jgi:catechol-2,3-dioxygenase